MTAKEHYDRHLGNFYSWMTGNFSEKQSEQQKFFELHKILPFSSNIAFDLGAGHGLQAVSLAKLGFLVRAVDFNRQLLAELGVNKQSLNIEIIESDLLTFLEKSEERADVIVCMGDTLTHLENIPDVNKFFSLIHEHLLPKGKVVISFRDLSTELTGGQRFIPVKSDDKKILTCFLEFLDDGVMVHDILHENIEGNWIQKISAYPKLRLNVNTVTSMLSQNQLLVTTSQVINRMHYLIAEKHPVS